MNYFNHRIATLLKIVTLQHSSLKHKTRPCHRPPPLPPRRGRRQQQRQVQQQRKQPGAAEANLLGSARYSLIISASLKVISVTAAMASRFFMPLTMEWGAEATVGYPICRHTAATLATPCMNLAFRSSSVMSRISGENTVPASYTFWMMSPYVKGEIFSMFNRVASDIPTLSPAVIRGTSWIISMVPLVILVGILKAWKKEVFSGPIPVFWVGTMTSRGARAPALAGALTLLANRRSLTSTSSSLVKTKPTFCLMWGSRRSRSGFFSK